jgi:hypothetical protein
MVATTAQEPAPAPQPAPAEISMTFTHSPQFAAIAAALAKAQGCMSNASKDRTNPHFGQDYATLASVLDACREPLSSNGIAVTQMPATCKDGVTVTTILLHTSGEWLQSTLTLPVAQRSAQGIGGAITYARRYALSAMVGITQADDDGNDDEGRDDRNKRREPPPRNGGATIPAVRTQQAPQASDEEMQVKTSVLSALVQLGVTEKKAQIAEVARLNSGKAPSELAEWRAVERKVVDALNRSKQQQQAGTQAA